MGGVKANVGACQLHVLPGGFVRIRHFGFLANRGRAAKLARCRALLAVPPPELPPAPESVAVIRVPVEQTNREAELT